MKYFLIKENQVIRELGSCPSPEEAWELADIAIHLITGGSSCGEKLEFTLQDENGNLCPDPRTRIYSPQCGHDIFWPNGIVKNQE